MQSRSTDVEWDRVVFFTEGLKRRLKRPLGELRRGDVGFDEELSKAHPLVVVGDYSFARLRMSGLKPHVVVVDARIERRVAGEPRLNNYSVVRVRNPAGCITPEAAAAVVEAVNKRHGAVLVEGEEDL
ncbi:MAG: DUF359 domain-containing protein, partial [Candidatus Caldarchaeum sp.]|nr:DUF359 domain-containing protein [Candidatus Caldarchaeum sp.]